MAISGGIVSKAADSGEPPPRGAMRVLFIKGASYKGSASMNADDETSKGGQYTPSLFANTKTPDGWL